MARRLFQPFPFFCAVFITKEDHHEEKSPYHSGHRAIRRTATQHAGRVHQVQAERAMDIQTSRFAEDICGRTTQVFCPCPRVILRQERNNLMLATMTVETTQHEPMIDDGMSDDAINAAVDDFNHTIAAGGQHFNETYLWATAMELQQQPAITGDAFVLALAIASLTKVPRYGCR